MRCAFHVFGNIRLVLVLEDFGQVIHGGVEDRDHLAITLKQIDDRSMDRARGVYDAVTRLQKDVETVLVREQIHGFLKRPEIRRLIPLVAAT